MRPTMSDDPITRLLLALQHGEATSHQIRESLGITHRPTFRDNYLYPAIKAKYVEYTLPDKPQSHLQKYRLTDKGRQAMAKTDSETQK